MLRAATGLTISDFLAVSKGFIDDHLAVVSDDAFNDVLPEVDYHVRELQVFLDRPNDLDNLGRVQILSALRDVNDDLRVSDSDACFGGSPVRWVFIHGPVFALLHALFPVAIALESIGQGCFTLFEVGSNSFGLLLGHFVRLEIGVHGNLRAEACFGVREMTIVRDPSVSNTFASTAIFGPSSAISVTFSQGTAFLTSSAPNLFASQAASRCFARGRYRLLSNTVEVVRVSNKTFRAFS